jgi:hypothetical protein
MKRKQKKRTNPVFAVLLLLGSAGVAAKTLLGTSVTAVVGSMVGNASDENPVETSAESATKDGTESWQDLLAIHGSMRKDATVRLAFSAFEYPSFWAAPGGESQAGASRWVGEDPPLLRLGVVLVSAASRRCVLGGRVVGIGDEIATGTVVSIEPGVVVVTWQGRPLTYDLQAAAPREFRSELAQRATETTDEGAPAAPAGEGKLQQDSEVKETGK